METTNEVIASLEGMRVVVTGRECRLDLYNFVDNQWETSETENWPMSLADANRWLSGWNRVDRAAALSILAA